MYLKDIAIHYEFFVLLKRSPDAWCRDSCFIYTQVKADMDIKCNLTEDGGANNCEAAIPVQF